MCSEVIVHPRAAARTTGPARGAGGRGAGAKQKTPLVLIDRDLSINVTHSCEDEGEN